MTSTHHYSLRKRKRETKPNVQEILSNKKRLIFEDKSETLEELTSDSEVEITSEVEEGGDPFEDDEEEFDDLFEVKDSEDSEEGDKSEEEYFELDISPIQNAIHSKFLKLFPNLPEKDLNEALNRALVNSEDILERFCNAKPGGERWKVGLEEEKVEELEPVLKTIRTKIDNDKITLPKILESNIQFSDKIKAVELYDILENSEPFTLEYRDIEISIKNILKSAMGTPEILGESEKIEEELRSKSGDFIHNIKKKILYLNADIETKTRIYEMFTTMCNLTPSSEEYSSLKSKIIWAINLPHKNIVLPEVQHQKSSPEEIAQYCSKVYSILDSKLYGMKDVKEKLLQIVNNRIKNPKTQSMLALKGKPGVGKTRVAQALAESIGLPFEKIALGGMEDPGMFTGQDSSWVGSSPSILLKILRRMKCSNGIVLFDELDKLGNSEKGRMIQNTLLHITDYIQNKDFQDSYLIEFPHDLSQIWFMFAMNDDSKLDSALKDRLNIIPLKEYNFQETTNIIQQFILPETLKNIGLEKNSITITPSACSRLIKDPNTKGLRTYSRLIHDMVSKISMLETFRCGKTQIKLNYILPDFKGLPYEINDDSIIHFKPKYSEDFKYVHMFS
jgi:ATP-dependent Lon protease